MAKKLMMLFAAVALAGAVRAAATVTASGIYSAGTTTLYDNGTAYLYLIPTDMLNTAYNMLASDWFNDETVTKGWSASVNVDDGAFNAPGEDAQVTGSIRYLLAIYDATSKNMFVASATAILDGSTLKADFGDLGTASSAAATEWTSGMSMGTGWYKSAGSAVPEPTSGLLLLVGGALLALCRRRA